MRTAQRKTTTTTTTDKQRYILRPYGLAPQPLSLPWLLHLESKSLVNLSPPFPEKSKRNPVLGLYEVVTHDIKSQKAISIKHGKKCFSAVAVMTVVKQKAILEMNTVHGEKQFKRTEESFFYVLKWWPEITCMLLIYNEQKSHGSLHLLYFSRHIYTPHSPAPLSQTHINM